MLHSYVRVYIHLIWSTKGRVPTLIKEVRPKVTEHLIANAKEKNIGIDTINVQMDHSHALVALSSDQKIDDIVRLLKGESSHWINAENIIRQKFSWQRGYGAFSVSSSHLESVRAYIKNQDAHHRKKTFREEYETILRKYGFSETETDESVTQ